MAFVPRVLTNKQLFKIADFGLMRSITSNEESLELFLLSPKGTPRYMAPELIDPKPLKDKYATLSDTEKERYSSEILAKKVRTR